MIVDMFDMLDLHHITVVASLSYQMYRYCNTDNTNKMKLHDKRREYK